MAKLDELTVQGLASSMLCFLKWKEKWIVVKLTLNGCFVSCTRERLKIGAEFIKR